ncbi:MAG: lytic transglycosylase domain-containing protein [Patulibacter minatonensis]
MAPKSRRPAPARTRRWPVWLLVLIMLGGGGYALARPYFHKAVKELALPLQHDDIIRQQAREKGIDPSLIAGVIYTESHFRPRESPAGAVGLMQITPDTADFIAHKSGGATFETADLATPQINIAYGTYYLRYLLRRFDADVILGLAAYNGGEGNVEKWLAAAKARGEEFSVDDIPFTETREYVGKVLDAQERYRKQYWRELGLPSPG